MWPSASICGIPTYEVTGTLTILIKRGDCDMCFGETWPGPPVLCVPHKTAVAGAPLSHPSADLGSDDDVEMPHVQPSMLVGYILQVGYTEHANT